MFVCVQLQRAVVEKKPSIRLSALLVLSVLNCLEAVCVTKMKTYSRRKQSPSYDFNDTQLDFNEICRLCLSEEGEKFQIFKNVDDVPLPLRIMACVSVEVGLISEFCY
jgi:hypothetical protein